MASFSCTAISASAKPMVSLNGQGTNKALCLKSVSFTSQNKSFYSLRMQPARGFRVSCAAKPEIVEKVCAIVKKQLALPETTVVTGESKFALLGADSLDTVEIVMGLEEEFGISVEEDSAQSIETIQDAADLIQKLSDEKAKA